MNKKRIVFGWTLFAIMSPVVIIGMVAKFFYNYLEAGAILYEELENNLVYWLDK